MVRIVRVKLVMRIGKGTVGKYKKDIHIKQYRMLQENTMETLECIEMSTEIELQSI